QEAGQIDHGITAGERILHDYPHSMFELKVRYTLAHLYEKTADFSKAAGMYASFVSAYDSATGAAAEARAKKAAARAEARAAARKSKVKKVAAAPAAAPAPSDETGASRDEERRALLTEAEKWVADALFNSGLWFESLGESDKALTAYRSYLSRFKDRPDVPRIAYNVGLVQQKEGKWGDSMRTFTVFIDTYARDSRTSGGQLYLARYQLLRGFHKQRDANNSERLQKDLVYLWNRLSPEEKQQTDILDAYGHARFLGVETAWKEYVAIRFKRVSTVRGDLAAKQRAMQKLEKSYIDVLSSGSGEWGIAALTRIGLAYADFARNIQESPNPPGLDEEQQAMYRGELENLALPLEDKASEALDKALGKAYELSLYNEWTLAAQEQVNRYHPGAYAQVRQVPFRGSEFFATADVAKDAGVPEESSANPADSQQKPSPSTASREVQP
ncbi:MAG: gliding motility protein U, partial [Cystobacter sp.]